MWRTCGVLVLVAGLVVGCSGDGDSTERAQPKVGKQVVVTTFDFEPEGVAVDGAGTVYTSGWDGKQHVVVSVPRKGKPSSRPIPCAANVGTRSKSGTLVAAPDGTLYWSSGSQFRVVRLDPGGGGGCFAGTREWGASGDGGPATDAQIGGVNGLAIDPERRDLYIADKQDQTRVRGDQAYSVRKVDAAGVITTVAGFGGENAGGPPSQLAFDGRRGRWYVISTNGVISSRDRDGAPRIIAGAEGADMSFVAMAVDPTGGDLVAIRGGDAKRCEVVRVSEGGEVRPVSGGNLLPDCAYSVAVDATGDIWTVTVKSRLIIIRPLR